MKLPTPKRLPSGSWFVRVQVNGEIYPITAPTEKACLAEAVAVKAGGKRTARTPDSEKRLTDAIDSWISCNSQRLSPSTVRGYRAIQANAFPRLMVQKCSRIDEKAAEQAVNEELKYLSPKSVRNRWRFVQQVIGWATGQKITPPLPPVIRPDVEFLDSSEIDALLRYIRSRKEEILILLALSSLRRSEIAALTWDQIDLKHRWIHVRGAVVEDEHHRFVRKAENKTSASRRDVPIIDPLYDALTAVGDRSGPVVPAHPSTMLRQINRSCAAAGVPQVGCHGLRHSFASLCHSLGIPPQAAMEIGGWSDRTTMDRIYTHVSRRDIDSYESAFTDHFKNCNENCND